MSNNVSISSKVRSTQGVTLLHFYIQHSTGHNTTIKEKRNEKESELEIRSGHDDLQMTGYYMENLAKILADVY